MRRCLELDPLKRITAREAIDHEFLRSSSRGPAAHPTSGAAAGPAATAVGAGVGAAAGAGSEAGAAAEATGDSKGAMHAVAGSAPPGGEGKKAEGGAPVKALKMEQDESMS